MNDSWFVNVRVNYVINSLLRRISRGPLLRRLVECLWVLLQLTANGRHQWVTGVRAGQQRGEAEQGLAHSQGR